MLKQSQNLLSLDFLKDYSNLLMATGCAVASGYFFLKGVYQKDDEQIYDDFLKFANEGTFVSHLYKYTNKVTAAKNIFKQMNPAIEFNEFDQNIASFDPAIVSKFNGFLLNHELMKEHKMNENVNFYNKKMQFAEKYGDDIKTVQMRLSVNLSRVNPSSLWTQRQKSTLSQE